MAPSSKPAAEASIEALDRQVGQFVRAGEPGRAAEALEAAIVVAPANPALRSNLGYVLTLLDRLGDALKSYEAALALNPDYADAHYSRAVLLDRLERWGEAVAEFDRTITLNPDLPAAHVGRGAALDALQRFDEALASYDRAIAISPKLVAAHFNRGNVLARLERHDEALESFDRAIALAPGAADIHSNRGNLLFKMWRHADALESFDRAIALAPGFAAAHTNRGNVLNAMGRRDEALASHDAALSLAPRDAQALTNRGITLFDLGQIDAAIASYDRALSSGSGLAEAHFGRAVALEGLKRRDEALASYERAYARNPALQFLFGKLLHAKASLCDWSDRGSDIATLAQAIERGEKASPPFPVLALIDSPALQRKAAETYAHATLPPRPPAGLAACPRHDRIRLGYFSADFHDHATAVLMAELFERHDKSRFELFAFSWGPQTRDPMRARLSSAFEHFIDVRALGDEEIAMLARRHEIDIAVDLKGYTGDARPGIFAHRAAPIQANYLGYPGTLGAACFDYLIADATLIRDRQFYSEKIVSLPHSYQPNDTTRPIAANAMSRAEAGLPDDAFVFCCFNNSFKIGPEVFDRWMQILGQSSGSVLWLLHDNASVERNLRSEAAARGVAPERLVFAPRIALPEHLARHRLADLFLDTLPYNAHTTASDALWAGLPVLTLTGAAFAGRVAASLLQAIGLPELIAATPDAYVNTAVALAADPEKLSVLRQKLAANRATIPLFDIALFAANIERAFAEIHARSQRGLAPDHIDLAHRG